MKLTEKPKQLLEYENYSLLINMAFNNILRLYEMLDDETLSDAHKINIGLEMLVKNYETVKDFHPSEKQALFVLIFKEFLNVNLKEEVELEEPTMDFGKDADLIFASFFMDYRIDLFDYHDSLHWTKFMALMNGLSEQTPFMKVVNIRTMDVPKWSPDNQKQRSRIIKLKEKYRLEQPGNDYKRKSLDQAANFLRAKAGEKNGRRKN